VPRNRQQRPLIYWDTCIFLAWLKDETRAEGEMAGVYAVAVEVFEKKVDLVTSAVSETEIEQARLSQDAKEKWKKVFDLSNVEVVPLSAEMGRRAGELRAFYRNLGDGRPGLCQNDAYHLATAIVLDVTAFHTFDETDKKSCRGLLTLNGNVAGFPLVIRKPSTEQGNLDLQA
jgi:predicted nucleic acid-binding protein